jgi:methionine biosynthesis protein MetW
MSLRPDLSIISGWISPGARVLDLGCGDGTLLRHLRDHRQVRGYGLEINEDNVAACVEAGVNVLQGDLDAGLQDFEADSFDFVVLTQALQVVQQPRQLLLEMLRIGREGIVTFPNFAHWRHRVILGLRGRMPVSPVLPEQWYNTPNVHLCSVDDFEQLCQEIHVRISRRSMVDHAHHSNLGMRLLPNLLGEIALYRISN